ncbi:DNA-binding response regulator [Cellvibrio sp. KY-GH-1]|uniref:response regulator transcription factor n=1 Tax=Cellvibrio sp. KY-GH-1 TaxID=2303332 RepID=UPI0012470BD4|nr:response regulator transcription factor [Cellvibrio sp. KY-GH-1]QEY16352.1 DNA-binding response regulator [Cellvibrio sp. KY-GH-1]
MFASKVTALHPTPQRRFLVVEDETDLGNLIKLYLQDFQAEVVVVERGDLGLKMALEEHWDLMILDLRLPGMDGLDICRAMRSNGVDLPLIMLTARSTELDRVLGLELGADDYLTKPFSSLELAARVRALLRRSSRSPQLDTQEPDTIKVKQLVLDKLQHRVLLNNLDIELTAREFDLLWFFASHPGRVFNRSELLDKVWGYGHEGYEHTVNSHINRLRAKIERNPSAPEYLLTVWGVGYKFCEHQPL